MCLLHTDNHALNPDAEYLRAWFEAKRESYEADIDTAYSQQHGSTFKEPNALQGENTTDLTWIAEVYGYASTPPDDTTLRRLLRTAPDFNFFTVTEATWQQLFTDTHNTLQAIRTLFPDLQSAGTTALDWASDTLHAALEQVQPNKPWHHCKSPCEIKRQPGWTATQDRSIYSASSVSVNSA